MIKRYQASYQSFAGDSEVKGSEETGLWTEYLKIEGYEAYRRGCGCRDCQMVRDAFPKWKAERLEHNTNMNRFQTFAGVDIPPQ